MYGKLLKGFSAVSRPTIYIALFSFVESLVAARSSRERSNLLQVRRAADRDLRPLRGAWVVCQAGLPHETFPGFESTQCDGDHSLHPGKPLSHRPRSSSPRNSDRTLMDRPTSGVVSVRPQYAVLRCGVSRSTNARVLEICPEAPNLHDLPGSSC